MKLKILIAAIAFTSTTWAGGYSPALEKAHEAYRDGHFKKMTRNIKKAIENHPNDSAILENALELVRATRKLRGAESIPVDWKRPDEVSKIMFRTKRVVWRGSKRTVYEFFIESDMEGLVNQMKLVKFPNKVILDKNRGKGKYIEEYRNEKQKFRYELKKRNASRPLKSGLYTFEIELSIGEVFSGWFIIDDKQFSSDTPDIYAPKVAETLKTRKPTVRFEDFHSPEHTSDEYRAMWAGIFTERERSEDEVDVWNVYQDKDIQTTLKVDKPLANDNYMIGVTYIEKKLFGPMRLQRFSTRFHPFSVNAQD